MCGKLCECVKTCSHVNCGPCHPGFSFIFSSLTVPVTLSLTHRHSFLATWSRFYNMGHIFYHLAFLWVFMSLILA